MTKAVDRNFLKPEFCPKKCSHQLIAITSIFPTCSWLYSIETVCKLRINKTLTLQKRAPRIIHFAHKQQHVIYLFLTSVSFQFKLSTWKNSMSDV